MVALAGNLDLLSQVAATDQSEDSVAEAGAEMLFQVIAGRAEKAAVVITTNLPFSEWATVFPNARLCKAMVDRLTDRAHIIDTGDAYRFRRSLAKKQKSREGRPE